MTGLMIYLENWLEIEKDNLSRINTNFMKNKTKYIFFIQKVLL